MKKNKKIIILISSILVFVLLTTIGILNRETIMQRFSNVMLQSDEDEEEQELISYKIYDNTDVNNLKMVFTVQNEDGIEYIKTPNNNQINGYGKQKIAIDYVSQINAELNFKIKEVNKPEVEEVITILPALGTQDYPFLVGTVKQLKNLANDFLEQKETLKTSNIYYKLSNDIDLSGVEWTPIGGNSTSTAFAGYLDGNNFKISNLKIEGTNNYQGLFGYLTGQVYNLNIENASVSGTNYVGTIAGYTTNTIKDCTIANSEVTGVGNYIGGLVGSSSVSLDNNTIEVNILGTGTYVGGLTGYTQNNANNNSVKGTINGKNYVGGLIGQIYAFWSNLSFNKNYTVVNIEATGNYVGGIVGCANPKNNGWDHKAYVYINNSYTDANINANGYVGGIIGYAVNNCTGENPYWTDTSITTIQNCFYIGSVSGVTNVGGMIGYSHADSQSFNRVFMTKINNSYVAGEVKGNTNTGAVVGGVTRRLEASNTYWVPEVTKLTSSTYGTEKALSDMYSQEQFTGYDFTNIWQIEEGESMPYLKGLPKPEGLAKILKYAESGNTIGDSLLQILNEYAFNNDEVYVVNANNKDYSLHVYNIDGNLDVTEEVVFGDERDVANKDDTTAKNMVVLKVNGDINISESGKITAYADQNGYGGPKGMLIYCTGTLTNEGTISMTARGARAEGEDVYLWTNTNGTLETVPAEGAAGGDRVYTYSKNTSVAGKAGNNGTLRQTGGGGSRISKKR